MAEANEEPPTHHKWIAPDVRGAIPRIQHTAAHKKFLDTVRPQFAMVSIIHARRMLKAGETAASYFPDKTSVITTTTVEDNKLAKILPDQEAAMIKAFQPDYHIPTDFPVYGDDDEEKRLENTKNVAAGTLDLRKELPESIEIIPLIKGTTFKERQYCEKVIPEIDAPLGAYYATQQFTVPGNRQFYGVKDDLEAIARETNGFPMLVLGYMNPSDPVENREASLRGLPRNVVAASGLNAWVSRVKPREHSPEEMRATFQELATDVDHAIEDHPTLRD